MINLKKILKEEDLDLSDWDKRHILKAMKEACMQTIDMCLETIVDEEEKELQQCVEAIRDNIEAIKREIK